MPVSDYESDAVHYFDPHDGPRPAHSQHRTNAELNLSVLRRYLPSIRSIPDQAPSATVYSFSHATKQWEKSPVEGTLFICEQEPSLPASGHVQAYAQPVTRACVFVLNRRNMDNLIVNLCDASACEVVGDLIALSLDGADGYSVDAVDGDGSVPGASGGGQETRVIGLWIHPGQDDTDDTRDRVTSSILEYWRLTRLGSAETGVDSYVDEDVEPEEVVSAAGDRGRRISINQLFSHSNGASTR
jgi:hypothetical protein